MATFDCLIDTKPMADAVGSVSTHVNATTAAVAAMQAAVIKTEKDAADEICQNVDKGFFALIRSQMSMKLAKYYTDMNVKLMVLQEQAKSLASLQERMETDVNRLKREYYKIFHGLDKSLENRVEQLDRAAVGLAGFREALISDRVLKDAPGTIFSGKESDNTVQMALMARVKNKTSRALETIGSHIRENREYEVSLSDHLEQKQVEDQCQEYIPVVLTREQSMAMSGAEILQCYFPKFLSQAAQDRVQAAVMQDIEGMLNGVETAKDWERITNEFQKLLADSETEERVATEMRRLFGNGGC